MTLSDHERTMETLYWWGVPTLFRAPHNPDLRACDIALVGVPHSSGNDSTERDQHLGPEIVSLIADKRRQGPMTAKGIRNPQNRPESAVPNPAEPR